MGQAARKLREMWRKRYTQLLDWTFEEYASREIMLRPDQAMDCMEDVLERWLSESKQSKLDEDASHEAPLFRFNYAAYRREAYHYAVDRFYKTYFPRKRGGEPLPTSYLERILKLRREGKNPAQIATLMKQRKDTMGKQIAVAERRWHEAVARIEQIKQRFPHLVVPDPATGNSKPHTSRPQSKRQRAKARTGK